MVEEILMQSYIPETRNAAEWVPVQSIETREQPRHYFDPDKLEQLRQSIAQHGILEPLLVRPLSPNKYELVAGERRYRAALQLNLREVPVVIRQLSDEDALQLALIENLQREDLNPIEETEGILQLLALRLALSPSAVPALLYQMKHSLRKGVDSENNVIPNLNSAQGQQVLGVFHDLGLMSWLSFTCNRLPLINLPAEILDAIRCGKIAYTKALAIARIKEADQRQALLDRAMAENLSLNQIRAWIRASKPDRRSPPSQMIQLHRKLLKAKLWEDPQRWEQVETLLSQLEALLDKIPDP
jgi:ParB family transcriptional regulator, chromosome partitioning protein